MSNILILGATSDIAIALGRKFANHNNNIILAGRNVESLKIQSQDLTVRYGVNTEVVKFNATEFSSHDSFYSNLQIKPDIVICVFGYLGNQKEAEVSQTEAEQILLVNYNGAISILNIIANDFERKGSGTIVGISSVAGERGRQSNYLYGSAKAGFSIYLSGLRNRLIKSKVHVVSVKPGFVYTKMTENLELPKLLTAKPNQVANYIYKAVESKKNTIYILWFWKWIMLVIKLIPEGIFKKLRL